MKNFCNKLYILFTFRIKLILILVFILYNCFQMCGYMIVHAEMSTDWNDWQKELPENLPKPYEFPNPLKQENLW